MKAGRFFLNNSFNPLKLNIEFLQISIYINSMSTQNMIEKALTLSPKEKSQLIEVLLKSLDEPDIKIEEIWNSEIDKRLNAIENGSTMTIPYDKIF